MTKIFGNCSRKIEGFQKINLNVSILCTFLGLGKIGSWQVLHSPMGSDQACPFSDSRQNIRRLPTGADPGLHTILQTDPEVHEYSSFWG